MKKQINNKRKRKEKTTISTKMNEVQKSIDKLDDDKVTEMLK